MLTLVSFVASVILPVARLAVLVTWSLWLLKVLFLPPAAILALLTELHLEDLALALELALDFWGTFDVA